MGKDTGFIEIEKQAVPRRAVAERVQDFREYDAPFEIPDLRKQAARCMDCGTPFCQSATVGLDRRVILLKPPRITIRNP